MARTKGALHCDGAVGTVGAITHRTYRGVGVASSHKLARYIQPRPVRIISPLDIPSLFARYTLSQGVTLTPPPGTQYVISIEDQKGGLGKLENLITGDQPRFYPADPAHNNRPYCYFDGASDRMRTPLLTTPVEQPFEIWMVQSGLLISTSYRRPFIAFKDDVFNGYYSITLTTPGHWIYMSLNRQISDAHDASIFLNRLIVNSTSSFCEWNGVRQLPNVNCGFGNLERLMVAHRWTGEYCRFNLFEIDIFKPLTTPVQRALLLNWFLETYNLQ